MADNARLDTDQSAGVGEKGLPRSNSGFRKTRIAFVDVDHTLSDAFWRDCMLPKAGETFSEEEWIKYHKAGYLDEPLDNAVDLINALYSTGWLIVLVTMRNECIRGDSMSWLANHEIPFNYLLMRPDGDRRASSVLKLDEVKRFCQLYLRGKTDEATIIIIDDNEKVCAAFLEEGCTVLKISHHWQPDRRASALSRRVVSGAE